MKLSATLLKKTFGSLAAVVLAAMLSACSGSQDPQLQPDKDPPPSGKMYLVITDAEGDFLNYSVDVTSIQLHKLDGSMVETVPVNTRIDFASYTDLSEFFSVLTLPEGTYDQIDINVDYTNADIVVQDDQGNPLAAQVVDINGQPINDFTLSVDLGSRGAVHIGAGKIAFVTLDFDLASSNTILSLEPATVQVEPFIVAHADLVEQRDHRARGLLESVDLTQNSFSLDLRPFHVRDGRFGQIDVQANDDTHYEIDGVAYVGNDGLTALANMPAGTPVIVQGQIYTQDRIYVAAEVYAGSSVPWDGMDAVRGVVIARQGDLLTVHGAHTELGSGVVTFRDVVEVQLADTTRVTRQLGADLSFDKNDVSVGSRILAVGHFTDASHAVLDTSEGAVRLLMNQVKGQVVDPANLTLTLARINGRPVSLFDFQGTGMDPNMDVDPTMFEVDTGLLPLPSVQVNDWVAVRGFFNAFGQAPADYFAKTVVDIALDHRAAHLFANWTGGDANAIATFDPEFLVFDLTTAQAALKIAGIPPMDLSGQSQQVIKPALAHGVYAIKYANQPGITVYTDFVQYSAALESAMADGAVVMKAHALGRSDQTNGDFLVVQMGILLN
jgi:hypothetical protein